MKDEIVLYQPNETIQLEVHLKDETVWLSQQQMAELFATDRTSILRHIGNIYKTHELDESATCAKIAQVRQEGGRTIVRQIPFYNLDMIISVGYRVNSIRGTRFRQWANKVIKDYMLKGYAVNQRLLNIENQLVSQQKQLAKHQEQIDFFVRTSLPPVEGIFYDGQIFDAYTFVNDRIREAKKRIVLIDNYVDDSVLTMLDKKY
ncbi:MAG: RhuM family protein [Paludibacteraceae bacterium]|nr:RhuM family protein [Paludibacteraceae bacterium]